MHEEKGHQGDFAEIHEGIGGSGATALLLGFREQTIDLDIKLDPEPKGVFEAITRLKNQLDVNVELAAPDNFIPSPPDWREHSRRIDVIGKVEFFHYDFSLRALAKLERGHAQDVEDVANLLRGGYVTAEELRLRFVELDPWMSRYPALDAAAFRKKVEAFLQSNS